MIGVTISGKVYAAIAATLPASCVIAEKVVLDGEYRLWLPRTFVERLIARREHGQTFNDVILRLAECGGFAAITQ
jgi:hypothetical protein